MDHADRSPESREYREPVVPNEPVDPVALRPAADGPHITAEAEDPQDGYYPPYDGMPEIPETERLDVPTAQDIRELTTVVARLPWYSEHPAGPNEELCVNRYAPPMPINGRSAIAWMWRDVQGPRSGDLRRIAVYYYLYQAGEEAPAELIKEPPFAPSVASPGQDAVAGVQQEALDAHVHARRAGFFDVTALEVREITAILQRSPDLA